MGQRDPPIRKLTGHEEGPECPSSTGFHEHTKCAPTYGLGEEAVEEAGGSSRGESWLPVQALPFAYSECLGKAHPERPG